MFPTPAGRRATIVTHLQIVVPDDYPAVVAGSPAEARLRALGDVTIFSTRGADNEAELIDRVRSATAVLNIRAHTRFSAAVLSACPQLRLISVWGTGTDHIDLNVCRERGVSVARTAGVNANAVAEHAVALMLAALRRIALLDAEMRTGGWACASIAQLEGKTVGIVGLGPIGRRVATLLRPFGVQLLATSHGSDDGRAASVGARHVPLDALLAESDVVSLHFRLDADTRGCIDADRLALMKPGAILVNTARGALVDQPALIDALRTGRIAGAALDVFHEEPLPPADPLRSLPNVVLTPHIAGNTPEVIAEGLALAVQNIESFLRAGRD